MEQDPTQAKPVRIGRYENLVLLGQGGMGSVYRALDPQLDREVALKVMNDRSPQFVARFRREARAMARLSHPRVVQVYDFGEDETGSPYFVMELLPGRSLDRVLQHRGPLPPRLVAQVLLQAAEGLAAAHAAGIVHRDIKPANLVLDEGGQLKLVDFGIARMEEGQNALTRPQSLIGTPHYMAPEVLSGKPVDGRADIYALGLTAYHLLVGHPPFDAPSAVGVAMKQMSEPLPDLGKDAPTAPPALVRLIERMCDKDRDRRIQRCEEVVQELQALLPQFEEAPARTRARPPLGLLLGGGAVLVLGAALGLYLQRREAPVAEGAADLAQAGGAGPLATAAPDGAAGRTADPPPEQPADPSPRLLVTGGPLSVAVLQFKNLGGDRDLEFLTEGISETVVTALGGVRQRIRLVERNQVDRAIKEIDFGQTKYVDKATAVALGRIQGAQVAVQGGYQRAGGQIRVTARFVRIETGEILDTMVLTRPADALFDVQDAVAAELRRRLLALLGR